ncbi:hypothetical protein QWI29_25135 [Mycolicibacterium neoaurum]|uniref:hypothetical protein n=2 Tax=Mycobacteriaceae TaxID=1762 RepID=UPI002672636D|nr:hypothetical protein [Mycolicibacterium neoaurum]MDO3403341.1 hypothetical protein [Mycolicibacterium neoaurum]
METNVEFAGTGMIIFRLLIFVTVKPEADDGTLDEPGVRVMATGEPAVTEPGATPSTDVVMLEVWETPRTVPWQLQLTVVAAFATPAKHMAAASAIGVTAPTRSIVDVFDRITYSQKVRVTAWPESNAAVERRKDNPSNLKFRAHIRHVLIAISVNSI